MGSKPITFKKVKHDGCHQDYRIYLHKIHVGNIRRGFTTAGGKSDRWTARSDVDGLEITVGGKFPRMVIAMRLLRTLRAHGFNPLQQSTHVTLMQLTKDVGHEDA